MKKILVFATAIALLAAMTVTAYAATGLTATNAVGKAGQAVELTFSVDGSVKGDWVKVEYSYDDSLLVPQPQACRWYPQGGISNFHNIKNIGAWAASSPVGLQGKLCSLSFGIKAGVSFDSTTVSCTVTILKDSKEVAKYTATGIVSATCIHSYGLWESVGEFNHERSCTVCGEKQTSGHSWDKGKQIPDPQNANNSLMVFTCTGCATTKEIPMAGVHTPETQPEPTVRPTEPDNDYTHPTKPTESTGPDEFQNPTIGTAPEPERDPFTGELVNKEDPAEPTQSFVDYNEPDHTHPETTAPMFIEHDHDHTDTATDADRTIGGYVAAAVGLVILAALVFVVKKKS